MYIYYLIGNGPRAYGNCRRHDVFAGTVFVPFINFLVNSWHIEYFFLLKETIKLVIILDIWDIKIKFNNAVDVGGSALKFDCIISSENLEIFIF